MASSCIECSIDVISCPEDAFIILTPLPLIPTYNVSLPTGTKSLKLPAQYQTSACPGLPYLNK